MTTTLDLDSVRADADARDRNARRRDGARPETCLLCERGLTAAQVERGWWVRLGGYGSVIVEPGATIPAEEDLGEFPVGSECAKRVPLALRFRRPVSR